MAIAAIASVPFGGADALRAVPNGLIMLGIGVAILSSAIPFTLEIVALSRLPKQTFSTLTSMEPAIAALIGLLVLSEQLSAMQLLAIGFIITASIGATMTVQPAVLSLPE